MDDFIRIASSLGVPVAGMAFMAWSLYKISVWVGKDMAKPLIDGHIGFLASVTLELKKQTEAYGVQSKILQELSVRLQRMDKEDHTRQREGQS